MQYLEYYDLLSPNSQSCATTACFYVETQITC